MKFTCKHCGCRYVAIPKKIETISTELILDYINVKFLIWWHKKEVWKKYKTKFICDRVTCPFCKLCNSGNYRKKRLEELK